MFYRYAGFFLPPFNAPVFARSAVFLQAKRTSCTPRTDGKRSRIGFFDILSESKTEAPFFLIDYSIGLGYNDIVLRIQNRITEVTFLNILVVGAGKVGSNLAITLETLGHDVSLVDENTEHLDAATNLALINFNGLRICGVPIDVDVLRSAGIESCDAVAAVTPDDNINIMVAEVATQFFGIKNVFARIYDPAREKVFAERLDLKTICPTRLTIDAVLCSLTNGNTKN